MTTKPLYIIHPHESNQHDVMNLISNVREVLDTDWYLIPIALGQGNSFKAKDVFPRIYQRIGPVAISRNACKKPILELRERLLYKCEVRKVGFANAESLWEELSELILSHDQGNPQIPRRYAVAVMLVRKLYDGKYWGGTRDKNYLAAAKLAKGRGVDEVYADIAPVLANELMLKGLLKPKYNKGDRKKKQKYALNPERRAEIDGIVASGIFNDDAIRKYLMKDHQTVPRNTLKWPLSAHQSNYSTAEVETIIRLLVEDNECAIARLNHENAATRRIPTAIIETILGVPNCHSSHPREPLIYNTTDGQVRINVLLTPDNDSNSSASEPCIEVESVDCRMASQKGNGANEFQLKQIILNAMQSFRT